ncbi:PDZ domain-containing protein [Lacipirellula limnantheis]|uniref:Periplasmic pH-dependent serine endoprotease DegQ n=1 Tax=Lacipirellula limnantheis TaxID=2528024 RepID=A0A517TZP3_9BACT|nr:PDZ domain-containing protein [Lacipirellula limnantheis]QDT73844.1 Periplasmic pH-dependent serine endoprotease DegQ precursor [Lacipirellula limnantheis]
MRFLLLIVICLAPFGSLAAAQAELDDLEQGAIAAAVDVAEKSVVQIRTIGGIDQLEGQTLAQGPTTGLIISAEGLIVSSAFNFAQQPTSILVRLPDGKQRAARIVGRDDNRMLVLLQVETFDELPAAEPADLASIRPGNWAIALGRSFNPEEVSVSVGVVSALRRMHGRAIQTDVNVSATNYGGPLIDLQGRVMGILVPMAPQSPGAAEANVTAGSEFYDSGIGFAIPLVDVLAVVDRWVDEQDLHRGLLGIGLKPGNPHSTAPIVANVWPRAPAAIAGWRAGDRIVAVNGVEIATQTDLRFQTMPHYAGDKLQVTLRRGAGAKAKRIETEVTLAKELPPFLHPFLGVLPERPENGNEADVSPADAANDKPADDTAENEVTDESAGKQADGEEIEGLAIRAIWPGSPADDAGLRRGDRLLRIGDKEIDSVEQALAELNGKSPGDSLQLAARRAGEELKLQVALAELPKNVLEAADLGAGDDAKVDGELGDPTLQTLKLPEMSQTARYLQPPSGPSAPGLLVWLGEGKSETAEAMAAQWQRTCVRDRLVLLMPEPADAGGWTNDDMEYLARLLQTAGSRWQIDPRRIVVAGQGKGGQLAYALALRGRKLIRGVAAVDSPLPRTLEVPENNPNERLAILAIETQNSPLAPLIRKDLQKFADAGYPVTQIVRRGEEKGDATLDGATRAKLGRWIDGLDRF